MADRDNPAVPFAAGFVLGALVTVLGYKFFSSCPSGQTHQIAAQVKCTCKKGSKEECKMHCVRGDHKCS